MRYNKCVVIKIDLLVYKTLLSHFLLLPQMELSLLPNFKLKK
jgi:hypothetical protein